MYDVLLYTQTDAKGQPGYLIEYDPRPSEASPLLDVLKRQVLRAKVRVRDVSEEYSVWSAWGSDAQEAPPEWSWAKSGVVEPVWKHSVRWPWGNGDLSLQDRRVPGMGTRMLAQNGEKRTSVRHYASHPADHSQLEVMTTMTCS
jgi:transferase CAF17, mitochondrial